MTVVASQSIPLVPDPRHSPDNLCLSARENISPLVASFLFSFFIFFLSRTCQQAANLLENGPYSCIFILILILFHAIFLISSLLFCIRPSKNLARHTLRHHFTSLHPPELYSQYFGTGVLVLLAPIYALPLTSACSLEPSTYYTCSLP